MNGCALEFYELYWFESFIGLLNLSSLSHWQQRLIKSTQLYTVDNFQDNKIIRPPRDFPTKSCII